MKKDGKKTLFAGIILIAAFAVWTALIQILWDLLCLVQDYFAVIKQLFYCITKKKIK